MTKKEIVEYLVENKDIPRSTAISAVEGVMSCLSESFKEGKSVYLRGFGTFKNEVSAPKTARNIRTGQTVIVQPRKRIRFIPCGELKEALNHVV